MLENIKIERNRRLMGLLNVDPHADYLWNKVLSNIKNKNDKTILMKAYNFARKN